jgi:hypothetical protein
VSLRERLGRWRRAVAPEVGHRHAWWSTAGELSSAFGAAAGVRRAPAPVVGPPLEQICADLRRINGEIARVLADPTLPARYHRLMAASWAYDEALADACRAVGLEPPACRPLDQYKRLATEVELTTHGVQW